MEKVTLLSASELDLLACCVSMNLNPEGLRRFVAIARWANQAQAWLMDHHSGHPNECEDPDCDIGALLAAITPADAGEGSGT